MDIYGITWAGLAQAGLGEVALARSDLFFGR